ncbi:metallophosphoesterase family protein [Pseudomonas sp. OTU5201]|uniref:metallophosphoesterase family protein n=1 Tax=Pseudomonas sp. OTU5201 TaxID=3043850 RepID=UPI00313E0B63
MIAVISDVHGNFPALRAVLAEADRLGCSRVISLGDVTGYYAEPEKCIDLLVARGAIQLLGNHDGYLTEGTGCPRSRLVSSLLEHQARVVRADQLALLASLSSLYEEGDACFVHGGWEDPRDQYLYRVSEDKLTGDWRFYFSGHTHVQVLATLGTKTYCNPGSVGQPRDGDPRAAFAVFDGSEVRLQRVAYDVDETVQAMRRAGYDEPRLWENLYIGAQIGGRVDKVEIIERENAK